MGVLKRPDKGYKFSGRKHGIKYTKGTKGPEDGKMSIIGTVLSQK